MTELLRYQLVQLVHDLLDVVTYHVALNPPSRLSTQLFAY
jgi:hypothetical protein